MKVNQVVTPTYFNQTIKDNNIQKVDFGSFLSNAITTVNEAEKTTQAYDAMLASGEVENLHDAMIAAQKAEITLNFALEIKTRVIEAYKELMRMQF